MLLRNIGGVIRGKVTPFQVLTASILGGTMGYIPGLKEAPGLLVALSLVLAIVNANLFVAMAVGLLAELLALATVAFTFEVGFFLLDGPTQPIFRSAINTPVLALFGLEHYVVTGGMVLGAAFGTVCGVVFCWGIRRARLLLAGLEAGSEKYVKYTSRFPMPLLGWILFGGRGGKDLSKLAEKKVGNPIRPLGAVAAVLAIALLYLVNVLFADDIVVNILRKQLEQANGATVEVKKATIDFKEGKLRVEGLAMADPNDLASNLIQADEVVADISSKNLLRKRIEIDHVLLTRAALGEARARPGVLVRPQVPPPEAPTDQKPGEGTLQDWIDKGKAWKDRLEQAREWMEKMGKGKEEAPRDPGKPEDKATLRERLKREIALKGHWAVQATHLIEGSPTVLVRAVDAKEVRAKRILQPDELMDLHAENLSTQPGLVKEPPRFTLKSSKGTLDGELAGNAFAQGSIVRDNTMRFAYTGLAADELLSGLGLKGEKPLQGGTVDLSFNGLWSGDGRIDAPLGVKLKGSMLTLPGVGSEKITELAFPLGLRGPISNPQVQFDAQQFADALGKAGLNSMADKYRGKLQDQIKSKVTDKITSKLTDKIPGGLGDKVGGALGNLIPGGKKPDAEKKPDAQPGETKPGASGEAKPTDPKAGVEDAIKGGIDQGLKGLLGGKKDKKPAEEKKAP